MKKHLILLLVVGLVSLNSCSSDDDNPDKNEDPIIGTWVLTDIEPPTYPITLCDEPSTITFHENYTGTASFFIEENECVGTDASGAWKNEGSSIYSINVPFLGNVSGAVEFSGANTFFFETNTGATLKFEKQIAV